MSQLASQSNFEGFLPVESIKRGEFVRRKPDAAKTYQRGEYDPSTKRYSLVDCDDVNREVFVKRGTFLFTHFDY